MGTTIFFSRPVQGWNGLQCNPCLFMSWKGSDCHFTDFNYKRDSLNPKGQIICKKNLKNVLATMHDGLQDQRQWLMRSTALHLATLWLPRKGNALTYNTIISEVLCSKLTQIAVSASTCYWMTNFDRQESTDWERSWSWSSKIVGMTLDNILQHWPPTTILYNTVETFRFQGSIISYDLKWVSNVDSGHQEGQWENVFHAPIQKVQPASGDPDPVLPLNCPVCTSIIVWFGWATKLEQTTMGSQDCRGNHW